MEIREQAILKMKKILKTGETMDGCAYQCVVSAYDEKKECIYLLLKDAELTELSLDAIYECVITSQQNTYSVTGRIRSRYENQEGKMFELYITNGFYKNSIKSVDKI